MTNLAAPWHLIEGGTPAAPTLEIRGTVQFGAEAPRPAGISLAIGSTGLKFRPPRSGSHKGERMRYAAFTEDDRRRARLLAAAPELLEALKRVLRDTDGGRLPCTLSALEAAHAAIARAEGDAEDDTCPHCGGSGGGEDPSQVCPLCVGSGKVAGAGRTEEF